MSAIPLLPLKKLIDPKNANRNLNHKNESLGTAH